MRSRKPRAQQSQGGCLRSKTPQAAQPLFHQLWPGGKTAGPRGQSRTRDRITAARPPLGRVLGSSHGGRRPPAPPPWIRVLLSINQKTNMRKDATHATTLSVDSTMIIELYGTFVHNSKACKACIGMQHASPHMRACPAPEGTAPRQAYAPKHSLECGATHTSFL